MIAVGVTGLSIPLPVVILGTIIGITYGLLAMGLVLIYRSNRIINFAHGEIGLFAAALLGVFVTRWHLPYYLGFVLALAAGGSVATIAELAVIRRLKNAPRLMSVVATLGVGQFLIAFGFAINGKARAGTSFPQPPFLPTFTIGALTITRPYAAMLLFSPLMLAGLVLILNRTKLGLGIRSAATNPEAARMAGVYAGRMSSAAWALAGLLSAFTAILILPSQGFAGTGQSFGPSLLLRALAAAVLGRMTSLPKALAGGVAIGIIEQLVTWNYPQGGFVSLVLFVVIVMTLLFQRQLGGRESEKGSWAAIESGARLPESLRDVWAARNLGRISACIFGGLGVLVVLRASNSTAATVVGIIGFAIVGLSVGLITGLSGQLSLGQYAVAGVGGVVFVVVVDHGGNEIAAFLYAAAAAALTGLLVGLPSLRGRGLFLTVSTLAFALVVETWGLAQPWALGPGRTVRIPQLLGHTLESGHSLFLVAVVTLAVAMWACRNVRGSGFGRLLVAIRDNEDNARAFAVRAGVVKAQGLALAGAVAGVGGALVAVSLAGVASATFPVQASVDVVAMSVIGGLSMLAGPLLGALYIVGVPQFVHLDSAGLAATQFGWLLLILYVPGGIAQLFDPLRAGCFRLIARIAGVDLAGEEPTAELATVALLPTARSLGDLVGRNPGWSGRGPLLEARNVAKEFGGVRAVNGVSLSVREGETVGLIGPNGAGKTTLFELLGGFIRADGGSVFFDGAEVTALGPEKRATRGLIRSFQDAALFPTMTVADAVAVALERVIPTRVLESVAGLSGRDRRRQAVAAEVINLMGLAGYRETRLANLSTGTRRIAELACLVAVRPRLLLLDEPSSGIAQRETEALGGLLLRISDELGVTLCVIEHDITLIMSISSRIIAMDAGEVIADGSPEVVRADDRVASAYLGGNLQAIERSGGARVAVQQKGNT